MIRTKKWVKPVSRMMVLNMVWLTWMVTSAEAHQAQTASPETPAVKGNVHWAVLEAIQNYPQGEDRKFPEKNTVFANAGNFGGFIITYSAVLAGYLVLYVPLGSYGAAKCVFDKEEWNDCWNGYMNRTFH